MKTALSYLAVCLVLVGLIYGIDAWRTRTAYIDELETTTARLAVYCGHVRTELGHVDELIGGKPEFSIAGRQLFAGLTLDNFASVRICEREPDMTARETCGLGAGDAKCMHRALASLIGGLP